MSKHFLINPNKGEISASEISAIEKEKQQRLNIKELTQEQLAEKVGTNKSYISRIENNASDIRLSTLMRIVQTGLGGHLKLTLQL